MKKENGKVKKASSSDNKSLFESRVVVFTVILMIVIGCGIYTTVCRLFKSYIYNNEVVTIIQNDNAIILSKGKSSKLSEYVDSFENVKMVYLDSSVSEMGDSSVFEIESIDNDYIINALKIGQDILTVEYNDGVIEHFVLLCDHSSAELNVGDVLDLTQYIDSNREFKDISVSDSSIIALNDKVINVLQEGNVNVYINYSDDSNDLIEIFAKTPSSEATQIYSIKFNTNSNVSYVYYCKNTNRSNCTSGSAGTWNVNNGSAISVLGNEYICYYAKVKAGISYSGPTSKSGATCKKPTYGETIQIKPQGTNGGTTNKSGVSNGMEKKITVTSTYSYAFVSGSSTNYSLPSGSTGNKTVTVSIKNGICNSNGKSLSVVPSSRKSIKIQSSNYSFEGYRASKAGSILFNSNGILTTAGCAYFKNLTSGSVTVTPSYKKDVSGVVGGSKVSSSVTTNSSNLKKVAFSVDKTNVVIKNGTKYNTSSVGVEGIGTSSFTATLEKKSNGNYSFKYLDSFPKKLIMDCYNFMGYYYFENGVSNTSTQPVPVINSSSSQFIASSSYQLKKFVNSSSPVKLYAVFSAQASTSSSSSCSSKNIKPSKATGNISYNYSDSNKSQVGGSSNGSSSYSRCSGKSYSYGSTGDCVKGLQVALSRYADTFNVSSCKYSYIGIGSSKYSGTLANVDGIIGSKTRACIVAAQKKMFPNDSSQWDGIAGSQTISKLKSYWP